MKQLRVWNLPLIVALVAVPCHGQTNVTTRHNDNWRTGQNTSETHLTTSSFANHGFGLLCKISLPSSPQQEQIYAQPLVISNVDGSMTVYVVTMQDNVYAFSVPSTTSWNGQTCAQLKATAPISLLRGSLAGQYPADACFVGTGYSGSDCSKRAICPSVGILGTPAIDAAHNTMYLITESQDTYTGTQGVGCTKTPPLNWFHYLHALGLTSPSLAEKNSGPVPIAASQGNATFKSKQMLQRPGLLFLSTSPSPTWPTVYAGFSMMDGSRPNPSGWVLAYDGGNLGQGGFPLVFATTPGVPVRNPAGGGVWLGGEGLPAGLDVNQNNDIYVSTADGVFDSNSDYGDTFIKLNTQLQLSDSFTPADWDYRWNLTCNEDLDLGSSGTMLVPDGILAAPYGHVAIKGDKEGYLWVLKRDTLGGAGTGCPPVTSSCLPCTTGTNPSGVFQQFPVAGTDAKTTPAFWYDGTTPYMYVGQHNTQISQYRLNCAHPNGPICSPAASTTSVNETMGYTPTVSVSSNGTTAGIVWAIKSSVDGTDTGLGLYAFDAENLANMLYQPVTCQGRDVIGTPTKFSAPTVANGYVFVGTLKDFDIFGTGAGPCN